MRGSFKLGPFVELGVKSQASAKLNLSYMFLGLVAVTNRKPPPKKQGAGGVQAGVVLKRLWSSPHSRQPNAMLRSGGV